MTSQQIWIGIGLAGQLAFTMRFFVQWVQSERQRRSVTPIMFWYFSLAGGVVLLAYAIHRRDPVFILGQSTGVFIYLRNLQLIARERRRTMAPTPTPMTSTAMTASTSSASTASLAEAARAE
jgi:lipid-A-disaccharide synthase-like uncharacterized protein